MDILTEEKRKKPLVTDEEKNISYKRASIWEDFIIDYSNTCCYTKDTSSPSPHSKDITMTKHFTYSFKKNGSYCFSPSKDLIH